MKYNHGDLITIKGNFECPLLTTNSFTGGKDGAIESSLIDSTPTNNVYWNWTNTTGNKIIIDVDGARGKVIGGNNNYDGIHYPLNSVLHHDCGYFIPENTKIYWGRWLDLGVIIGGSLYPHDFQIKHMRIAGADSIEDSLKNCIKYNSWWKGDSLIQPTQEASIYNGKSYLASQNLKYRDHDEWSPHNGWALLEYFVNTGTQSQPNGRVVMRMTQNNKSNVIRYLDNCIIYDTADRLRYFIDQMYLGNWAQVFDKVDSQLPRPEIRNIYRDDMLLQIGGNAWNRAELRSNFGVRELQQYFHHEEGISFQLNLGAIDNNTDNNLSIVIIQGIDSFGKDNIVAEYYLDDL